MISLIRYWLIKVKNPSANTCIQVINHMMSTYSSYLGWVFYVGVDSDPSGYYAIGLLEILDLQP